MPGGLPIGVHLVPPIQGGSGFAYTIVLDQAVDYDIYVTVNVSDTTVVYSPNNQLPMQFLIPANHTEATDWFETNTVLDETNVLVTVGPANTDLSDPANITAAGTQVVTT